MRYGFAKILGSQESGYSGDKPNQRGKYILVPKPCLKAFPPLSKHVLNDQTTLKCWLPNGTVSGLNVVYHNAKFFPNTHKRDHDEVRVYRNTEFETSLKADRGVLVVFLPIVGDTLGSFAVFSITENDSAFDRWKAFDGKTFSLDDVSSLPLQREVLSNIPSNSDASLVSNFEDVVEYVSNVSNKTAKTQREQQAADLGDPAIPLSPLIGSQAQFSAYIRDMYGSQCCLRQEALLGSNNALGLDAAHIKPHSHGGPLLPTNGLLLSADLHRAFEAGAITLTLDCKVEIHPKVSRTSSIIQFANLDIAPHKYEIFKPHSAYIEYHRDNVFNRFAG